MDKEIELIKNSEIKEMVKIVLSNIPSYFWEVPASSTGKYHPQFSLGNGGLVRHTKAAVKIASDLLLLDQYSKMFTSDDKDIIIASLILHDNLKHGKKYDKYTLFLHPVLMKEYLEELYNNKVITLDKEIFTKITNAIASHMGQWNTNKYETRELPKVSNDIEEMVHMCDYLSSRKYLDILFDKDNNILERDE